MNKISIVFMGTPEFAVPCLEKIINDERYEVKAVFTQPDKPIGRKMVITPPAVKVIAEKYNIPVFQPDKIRKNLEVIRIISQFNPHFLVVVAYGKILPKAILDIPKGGCINVHGSLLEKYRGAAPMQWALANGEKVTGVTTMLMDEGMDTGDMLLKSEIEIDEMDTLDTLASKLSASGAELLMTTLEKLYNKEITPIKQNHDLATNAPIIKKNDGFINWSWSAEKIYNYVRAFGVWPSVYTFFAGKTLKITSCSLESIETDDNQKNGQIIQINKKGFVIKTGEGTLLVRRVQLAGSKEMLATDFIRGHRVEEGYIFENDLIC